VNIENVQMTCLSAQPSFQTLRVDAKMQGVKWHVRGLYDRYGRIP